MCLQSWCNQHHNLITEYFYHHPPKNPIWTHSCWGISVTSKLASLAASLPQGFLEVHRWCLPGVYEHVCPIQRLKPLSCVATNRRGPWSTKVRLWSVAKLRRVFIILRGSKATSLISYLFSTLVPTVNPVLRLPLTSFPGEGNGNPLQYSCLENPWTEEPGGLQFIVSQSQTWLSD